LLSGAHTERVYDAARRGLTDLIEETSTASQTDLRRLAEGLHPPRDALAALVVVNTLAFARTQTVEFDLPQSDGEPLVLTDGKRIFPYQLLDANVPHAHAAALVTLPPLAWQALWIVPRPTKQRPVVARARAWVDGISLHNGWLDVEFDPTFGSVRRIRDRARRHVYDFKNGVRLVGRSHPDDRADAASSLLGTRFTFVTDTHEVLEAGPLRAAVQFRGRLGKHPAAITYRLTQADKSLAVDVEVTADPALGAIELRVPLFLQTVKVVRDTPYGRQEVEAGEFPVLHFVDLVSKPCSLALLNDGIAGGRITPRNLYLSLARRLDQLHPLQPAEKIPLRGPQRFRLAFLPHAGDTATGRVHRSATAFATPLLVESAPADEFGGRRRAPKPQSLLTVSADAIEVGALYRDENAIVLRLVERTGQAVTATVRPKWRYRRVDLTDLLGRRVKRLRRCGFRTPRAITLTFRPFEIKTLRFSR
jgi:alpha-mannosidase